MFSNGGRAPKSGPRRLPLAREEKMAPGWLRIIAGEHRSRRIYYNGDHSIRPMKDRTRESVFNLLGGHLSDHFAIDLFGGTGVMAMEAISRGASDAIILEMSRSAVHMILENITNLKLADRIHVHNVDTLRWLKHVSSSSADWPKSKWVVFCCPPYRMWLTDGQRLCSGLHELYELSPPGSQFVLESDDQFDVPNALPECRWDVREYNPARIAIGVKPEIDG